MCRCTERPTHLTGLYLWAVLPQFCSLTLTCYERKEGRREGREKKKRYLGQKQGKQNQTFLPSVEHLRVYDEFTCVIKSQKEGRLFGVSQAHWVQSPPSGPVDLLLWEALGSAGLNKWPEAPLLCVFCQQDGLEPSGTSPPHVSISVSVPVSHRPELMGSW